MEHKSEINSRDLSFFFLNRIEFRFAAPKQEMSVAKKQTEQDFVIKSSSVTPTLDTSEWPLLLKVMLLGFQCKWPILSLLPNFINSVINPIQVCDDHADCLEL